MARTSTKKAEETKETKPVETPVEDKVEETAQETQEAVSEPKKEQDVLTISRDELNALIASAVASALAKTARTSRREKRCTRHPALPVWRSLTLSWV